jgi:hypothetical protein
MSDFPSLAEVVTEHRWMGPLGYDWLTKCSGCGWGGDTRNTGKTCISLHAEHVEQKWREACTVRTIDQLDALPEGSLLSSGYCRGGLGPTAWGKSAWFFPGSKCSVDGDMIGVPAVLLWHPDWERVQ